MSNQVYEPCKERTKLKLLLWMQLNGGWWRPSQLDNSNYHGVGWTSTYQLKKALRELAEAGQLEHKLFERGHFRYFAYKAKERINHDTYKLRVGEFE